MANTQIVNGFQVTDYSDEIYLLQKFLTRMINTHNNLLNKQDDACLCLDKPIESIIESLKDYRLRQKNEKYNNTF